METVNSIRPPLGVDRSQQRGQTQPIQPQAKTERPDAPSLRQVTPEAPPTPESLEGRDLSDPFESRRNQERVDFPGSEPFIQPPANGTPALTAATVGNDSNELTDTEQAQTPGQAALTPRAVARYQDVPRVRAERLTATGTPASEPEPFAEAVSEGRLETAESDRTTRASLERANEDRVRRGSADVAGTALSAAGEQLATVVDDRSLENEPPAVTPLVTEAPEEGLEAQEATEFATTLPGVGDLAPSQLEPRQDTVQAS